MSREVSWLLVGAGDIARKRVAPALASAPFSSLCAVCDPREDLARELASAYGAGEVYADIGAALKSTKADAVYLATPVRLHAEHALAVLESGRNLLSEKPLGLDAAAAKRVVDSAAASGHTAACAYFRRLSPRFLALKEMIRRGELGRIVLLRLTYYSWFAPEPDDPKYWRVVRSESGGGPLSDMGSHMFDLLIDLFGLPELVYAKCDNLVHRWDVEDTASVAMTFRGPDGPIQAVGAFGWNSKTWRHEFELVGTDARIRWLPFDGPEVEITRGREISTVTLADPENVHLPLVIDFVEALRKGRSPVCPVSEAAKTNLLLDAIYSSSWSGIPVVPETASV